MSGDGRAAGEGDWEEGTPVPLYIVTGGRTEAGEERVLDLVTLIVARSEPQPGMRPEHVSILRMCTGPLSVAELSAYLDLPFSAVQVLLADLVGDCLVEARQTRAAHTAAADPDVEILKALIDGLQRL
ncbi:DUF742 domain-containing protein [Streptomyces verrucosisporus]|uniref:DUF742 domain-containing protein n=1 Tax=Streptomyces verrucosisporus TaxID=1695161 RepID=UPI0019D2A0AD|nr:DUF742 domain-containing protein [Streptomyces verrucosisporus]MBN3928245.1 DUF742 domain-containing protein [Streptomyces verrucosisporus]